MRECGKAEQPACGRWRPARKDEAAAYQASPRAIPLPPTCAFFFVSSSIITSSCRLDVRAAAAQSGAVPPCQLLMHAPLLKVDVHNLHNGS